MPSDGFTLGLMIPALVLAFTGWLVPRLLFHVFPEGVRPLFILAGVATLVMIALGMVFFAVLYLAGGVSFDMLLEPGWLAFLGHMLKLGAISALLWGPVMVLSVAQLPKRWKKEVW